MHSFRKTNVTKYETFEEVLRNVAVDRFTMKFCFDLIHEPFAKRRLS